MLRIAHEGLTFDDVLLLPGYSEVTAKDVSLVTRLTRNIPLNIPLVSAAMDTVTEDRLAIALAREGGMGVIHRNCPIEEQAKMVARVKRSENIVISNPHTVRPDVSIDHLRDQMGRNGISGFPVVDAHDHIKSARFHRSRHDHLARAVLEMRGQLLCRAKSSRGFDDDINLVSIPVELRRAGTLTETDFLAVNLNSVFRILNVTLPTAVDRVELEEVRCRSRPTCNLINMNNIVVRAIERHS